MGEEADYDVQLTTEHFHPQATRAVENMISQRATPLAHVAVISKNRYAPRSCGASNTGPSAAELRTEGRYLKLSERPRRAVRRRV